MHVLEYKSFLVERKSSRTDWDSFMFFILVSNTLYTCQLSCFEQETPIHKKQFIQKFYKINQMKYVSDYYHINSRQISLNKFSKSKYGLFYLQKTKVHKYDIIYEVK